MVRQYHATRNYQKGWRGNSAAHRLAALGIPSGRKSKSTVTPLQIQLSIQEAARQREIEREARDRSLVPTFAQEDQFGAPLTEDEFPIEEREYIEESVVPGQGAGGSFMPTPSSPAAPPLYSKKRYI